MGLDRVTERLVPVQVLLDAPEKNGLRAHTRRFSTDWLTQR